MSQTILNDTTETALQDHLIAFIRAFGLHRPDQTPCGQSVSVAEAHALMELERNEPLSQQALCDRLQLVKSTVSRVVSLLEARGWAKRRRDEQDGRAVAVYLTEAGRDTAGELAQARQQKLAGVLARIPNEERDNVIRALNRLTEALREQ